MNKTNLELDHIAKPFEKIIHGLIFLYILTIPFQTLKFTFMGLSCGLPELVFLLLAPFTIIQFMYSRKKPNIDRLDLIVIGWLLANILVGWHTGFDSIVIIEIIKTAYLILLYMVLKWTIIPEMIERMVKVIILSSLVAALFGIIGVALGYFGIETFLTIKRSHPYLIHVIQAKEFTPTPNMLASIIMMGVFFQLSKLSKNKISSDGKDYLILLTLLIGFSLTFSKTIVCLLIGIILILNYNYKSILSYTWRSATRFFVASLFILNILGTHFIIVEKDQNSELLKGDYIAGSALIETDNYSIYPSQYWSLKEIS
jgi:hypothetical protein